MKAHLTTILMVFGLLGCQTQDKENEKIYERMDQHRLSLYEVNLTTCASFSLACMTLATQGKKDPSFCNEALYKCVQEAEETYKKDTGKEPPRFTTK